MRQLASVTSLFSTFGGALYTRRINETMAGYLFEALAYEGCIPLQKKRIQQFNLHNLLIYLIIIFYP